MEFLKNKEVNVANGGYLVKTGTETPVFHKEFVELQEEAHYLVSLANKVKESDFTKKETKTFDQVIKEVTNEINKEQRTYLEAPKAAVTPTIDKLQKEALNWLTSKTEEGKTEKLNRILQKFNVIADFESFGLYFSQGIVKLKGLYTLQQIVDAITVLEPHLDVE